MKNISILFLCFTVALLSCQSQEQAMYRQFLLADDWQLRSSAGWEPDGSVLSTTQFTPQGWYDTSVPTTVMGALSANGLYDGILEGMAYKEIDRTPFDVSWWFRKTFSMPDLAEGQTARLHLDGLSYSANVWLNGQLIADRENCRGPFRQFTLDITPYLAQENVLAIEVFKAQGGDPNIGFVDWNPRPADESMGLYREVRLSVSGQVELQHPRVHSKVNTETLNEAWLTVETTLTNHAATPVKGKLRGTFDGKTFSVPVALNAGEQKIVSLNSDQVSQLHVRNPRLWWCHQLGDPDMYRMELEFVADNQVSDRQEVDFGIRQIEDYFTAAGHRGFKLNGKEVLVRSAGWTDDIFLRDNARSNETQVRYVKDMNMNSIRFENIWGTSQNIYDLCDRYGLLALVGWSCQWEWEHYLGSPVDQFGGIMQEDQMDIITQSLNDQVLWLRNHPSIITWYVGSDMMPRPELEKRYMEVLEKIDDRPVITAAKKMTSEISGPTGMKMYGPYEYVGPNYWYLDKKNGGAYGFNTETGIGAQLPVIESIRKMIPADKLWPINEYWDYHCTTATSAMNTLKVLTDVIDGKYGKAKDLTDYLNKADLVNYEGTRAMFEAFRVNIPEATGIVQWMLNSAWPSLYWQMYDYYLVPTAAYYSTKKANAARQLIYNYEDRGIYLVSEGPETVKLQGKVMIYDLQSRPVHEQTLNLQAAPRMSEKVAEIPVHNSHIFLSLQLQDNHGEWLTDNFYCLSPTDDEHDWEKTNWVHTPMKKYADFTPLNTLPEATPEIRISTDARGNEQVIRVEMENGANTSLMTRLALKDQQGELICPVFWSDNYVSLLPGEKRLLECAVDPALLQGKDLRIVVSGCNTPEKEIAVPR